MNMHKGFVVTNKGAEEVCSLEISELIKCRNIEEKETVVIFQFSELIDLCSLCYTAQSINKGVFLLFEMDIVSSIEENIEKIKEEIKKLELKYWISKEKAIKVECERYGEHDFKSVDIEIETGKLILEKIKKDFGFEQKTDFDNPDIKFFFYIYEKKGYFGIDFSGIELSKRQYKIFNHPESLKGTTGYVLARRAGFKKNLSILDPFMGSGIIVIEAGLYVSKFPVQYYNKEKLAFSNFEFFKKQGSDKFFRLHDSKIKKSKMKIYGYDMQMKYLKATQKNAKLAGVDKFLNLSRCEIEWLDTKIEKNSIDLIVTDPPRFSKHRPDKNLEKTYKELFYQADYILKRKGSITVFIRDYELLENAAKKHNFKIQKKYSLNQGKESFNIITYVRDEK